MALKHYGGSLPSAGPLEWTCPACGHQNAVPLKAGCQQCGQKDGAGARKVEERAGPQPSYTPTGAASAQGATADAAYHAWKAEVETITHVEDFGLLREAFMAGVAWAQGNREPLPPSLLAGTSPVTASEETRPLPEGYTEVTTLILSAPSTGDDIADGPTLQTILTALAFYRDNVLNYGAVPGQLDAQGVTDLVTRLSPEEAGQ